MVSSLAGMASLFGVVRAVDLDTVLSVIRDVK